MPRYRHWKNYGEPGDVIFVTTRVLDFAHVFDIRDHMVRLLFSTHRRWQAELHAYAVMVNHIHFVTKLPDDTDAPKFVQQVKGNSGSFFMPRLTEAHKNALSLQAGLNRRSLWQVGFHSTVLTGEMFWQKVEYSHLNPVRAELVESAEDYRWSSAHLFAAGHWDEGSGLMDIPMKIVLP